MHDTHGNSVYVFKVRPVGCCAPALLHYLMILQVADITLCCATASLWLIMVDGIDSPFTGFELITPICLSGHTTQESLVLVEVATLMFVVFAIQCNAESRFEFILLPVAVDNHKRFTVVYRLFI